MSKNDLYRDTWVRYLGYANELGESFKALIPRSAYFGSYAVAIGYVLADTNDKSNSFKDYKLAGDVLLWQMLASVTIPGFTINRLCKFARMGLTRSNFIGKKLHEPVITGVVLGLPPDSII